MGAGGAPHSCFQYQSLQKPFEKGIGTNSMPSGYSGKQINASSNERKKPNNIEKK